MKLLKTRKGGDGGKREELYGFNEPLRFGTIPWLCPKEILDLQPGWYISQEQDPSRKRKVSRHSGATVGLAKG